MSRTLVVYYSLSGKDTESVAKRLAEEFGGDLERLETKTPYPEDYEAAVEQGKREAESGFCPELKPLAHDPKDYECIVVGTPTWWYTMAPAVLSFMRQTDFAGKTVLPFQTHAGQPGHAISDMRKETRGAMLFSGLRLEFGKNGLVTPESEIGEWIAHAKEAIKG